VPRRRSSKTEPDALDDASAVDDASAWWLYLLASLGGRSYVGITRDLSRRLAQHNGELRGGAKATRAGRPWQIARSWGPFPHERAARLEFELKQRRGSRRLDWDPSTE
jgi:predicted GIY-YIG superfamily endonuclease